MPRHASTRMDTLGGRGNASEGFPGGKDWVEETEDGHTYQQEYGIFVEVEPTKFRVETWRMIWASYKTASEGEEAMGTEISSVKETYRRMEALYGKWRSGAKVECPEDLSHYLKGIVLNDYAHGEEDRELCIALTEAVIVLVCERLSNAPEEEVPYLELAVSTLEKELGYYTGEGGELMGDNYEVLFQQGAKFYGWK